MKKNELIGAFRQAAMASGYAFATGQPHRINGEVRVYPAAWLEPAVLKSAEGRTEGCVVYRAVMHLMELPSQAGQQESLQAALEADALAIVRSVGADENVCEVSAVSCTPGAQSLTAHGEVSVTLSCDVCMWFYV